jgi:hypothetical protein
MVRPKKPENQKRHNRLTVYLTDAEREELSYIAMRENCTMTQIVVVAVKEWLQRVSNSPEPFRQDKPIHVMPRYTEKL